jgi:cytochrome c oxidase assembly factor CtaG
VNEETSASGSTNVKRALRDSLAVLGLLLLVMCYVPPVEGWARHYEYVQAMQFLAFSVLVPALFVVGAPWRWLGLAASQPPRIDDDGLVQVDQSPRYVDRLVLARPHQVSNVRAIWVMVLFVALTIFWRSAPVVNFTVRHGWLVVLESLSTLVVGVVLWTDLVESPPLTPGATRPYRIGMSAIAMWTIWVLAYLGAMSHSSWYQAFHHVAGHGISAAADQQFTAAAMWFLSAAAFLPLVFWNLVHWLQSEENPTDELNRMVRRERILGP